MVKGKLKELGGDDWKSVTLEEVIDRINEYDKELFGDIMADIDVEEIKESYRRIHLSRDEKKAEIKQKLEDLGESIKEWPEIKPIKIEIEIPKFKKMGEK